jgi:hypothetical protein
MPVLTTPSPTRMTKRKAARDKAFNEEVKIYEDNGDAASALIRSGISDAQFPHVNGSVTSDILVLVFVHVLGCLCTVSTNGASQAALVTVLWAVVQLEGGQ